MSRILTINEMVEAARRLGIPTREEELCAIAQLLARDIARKTGVIPLKVTSEELELDGICGSFHIDEIPGCEDKDGNNEFWKEGGILEDLDSGGELMINASQLMEDCKDKEFTP